MHLLVRIDVAKLGDFLEALHDDGRPVGEVPEIVRLKSVLELSAPKAAADVEILDGLQIEGGAWNPGGFRANAGDDLVGTELALVEWLELAEHSRGAPAAAATGERSDGINGRILHDNIGEFAHLLGHGREGKILVTLDQTIDAAGVLLREETLRRFDKQINVQADRAEGDQQDEKLVAKNPAKGNIVGAQHTVESVFGKSIETIVIAGFAAEKSRAHHGGGGERDEQRHSDGYAENNGKFAEQAPDDSAHEKNGNEDGHQRSAHRENSKSDFTRAFHGGFIGLHAVFDVAGNVFDDHDGIVDDEAGGDGEGHEREIVQAVMAKIHDAEGADEGERNGHARDDGGPDVSQECKDYENHKDNGNHEGDFHIVDGSANGGGAVDGHTQMERRRDGGAEKGDDGHDTVDGLDHVRAGLAEDGDDDAGFSVR